MNILSGGFLDQEHPAIVSGTNQSNGKYQGKHNAEHRQLHKRNKTVQGNKAFSQGEDSLVPEDQYAALLREKAKMVRERLMNHYQAPYKPYKAFVHNMADDNISGSSANEGRETVVEKLEDHQSTLKTKKHSI